MQEPEGGIIFEVPNLVQEPGDEFSGVQDLVQEPENGFIAPEGARGMPEVTPTKRVGQLKILKPLFRLWVFEKITPPGGCQWG